MPNIGGWEILIIVVIIVVIFGGALLPRLGRTTGRRLVGLKKGLKEGEEAFKSAVKEDAEDNGQTEKKD